MFSVTTTANQGLLLDTCQQGQYRYQLHFAPWQQGLSWSLIEENRLEPQSSDPGIDLASLLRDHADASRIKWWQALDPVVKQNACRFGVSSARILQYASRHREVMDLLKSRPALLALLWFQLGDTKAFVDAVRSGQRASLKLIGLEGSKRQLRLLERINESNFEKKNSKLLFQVLSHTEVVVTFAHISSIAPWMYRIAIAYPWLVNSDLFGCLGNAVSDAERRRICQIIDDTLRLSRALGIQDGTQAVSRRQDFDQLLALHNRWMQRLNEYAPGRYRSSFVPPDDYKYQAPPLAETDAIQAISSYGNLKLEGSMMKHCVASYHCDIASGNYYVYRVVAPERATLGIKINRLGTRDECLLDQLRGTNNRSVKETTKMAVIEWLQRSR